jgi:integrase
MVLGAATGAEGRSGGEPSAARQGTGAPLLTVHDKLRRRSFEPLLTKAGLPRIRFHDLRHSVATLLLSQGIHPKIVSERLGHSRVSITLDLYSHVTPTMQQQAAETLDRILTS